MGGGIAESVCESSLTRRPSSFSCVLAFFLKCWAIFHHACTVFACLSISGRRVDSISWLTSYIMDTDDLFEFLPSVLWGHRSGSGHFNYVSSGEAIGIYGTHHVECPHHYLTPEHFVSLETAPPPRLIKQSVFISLSFSHISLESIFCPYGSVCSGHCR